MGRKKRNDWQKLTRQDLRGFDDYGTKAILYAMDHGGVGKISNRGHAMIKALSGEIMGVAPDTRKARQVIAIALRKHFGNGGLEDPELDAAAKPAEPEPELEPAASSDLEPTLECPDPTCEAVFVTEGARYTHIHRDHFVCEHPGCSFTRSSKAAVVSHYRLAHLGIRPRLGTGSSKRRAGQGHDLVRIIQSGGVATYVCQCGSTGTSKLRQEIADPAEAERMLDQKARENWRVHRRRSVPLDTTETTPPPAPLGEDAPSGERPTSRAEQPPEPEPAETERAVHAPASIDWSTEPESLHELAALLARIDQRVAELHATEQRVAELEAENAELRAALAKVREALS